MDDEEHQHLEALLQTHLANLHQLEAQAAKYGADVPLSIHNGIVDEKSKIAHIQTKLGTRSPTSDRSSLQRLRRQALTAYFQKQWEQAVDLLSQVMATDLGDDDTQKKLIEAKQQLRLQEDYQAACDMRDDGQWRAVLAAMDDIARRHPQYPDPEGLRQWAVHQQKEEMSARTVTGTSLASSTLARRFYRSPLLPRLFIPLLVIFFLGTVVFVARWMFGQADQTPSGAIAPTAAPREPTPSGAIAPTAAPTQPTNTPIYTGLITYMRRNGERTDLYALGPNSNAITLTGTFTSVFTNSAVLSVSPDRLYLAVVTSRDAELSPSFSYPRFIQARSNMGLFVVSADGQKSTQLFPDKPLHYVYAAYTSDSDYPLVIAILEEATVSYFVARTNGSDLRQVYVSKIVLPTATQIATAPAPAATPITKTPVP
jgi:hypothetical protein